MKKSILLKIMIITLLIASNFLIISPLIGYLTSNQLIQKAIYLCVMASVLFYSGWIMVVNKESGLWYSALSGSLVYFLGEGLLKAIYYYFRRSIANIDPHLLDTFIAEEFKMLILWGIVFMPAAGLISFVGGYFKRCKARRV